MDIKIYEVCRACMNNRNDSSSTVEFSEMSEKIIEMFTFCTSIQIKKNDGLPLNVCQGCTDNIQTCFNFINICKSTDEALRYYVTQNNGINNVFKKEQIDTLDGEVLADIKIENAETYCDDDSIIYPDFVDIQDNDVKDVVVKVHKKKKHKKKTKDGSAIKTKKKKIRLKKKSLNGAVKKLSPGKTVRQSYDCPVCQAVILGRNNFSRHLTEQHEDFKRFVCKFCKKGFHKANYLQQHEATHLGERPWKCDKCPKAYKQRSQLATHKNAHTNVRPFSCDSCPLTFITKCSMIAHTKLHHGVEQNLCHLCGVSFAQVGNLRVHMRVHTGEKPYACSICPFKCSVQSGMRRHERMHANLKTHKCPVCQKGFNNNGSMVRHIRIHTGELPYKCDYCPKAFIDNWKRKNHLVKAHNIALETIPKMIPGRKRQYVGKKEETKNSAENISKDTVKS